MNQHYSGEPVVSLERDYVGKGLAYSHTAATMSEALRIAFGGDVDEPAHPPVRYERTYRTHPAIRPVGEAFMIAFAGLDH